MKVEMFVDGESRGINRAGRPRHHPLRRACLGRVQKLVREQVEKALRAELSEVIADEKAKIVAAVRGRAADIMARAITEGIGR